MASEEVSKLNIYAVVTPLPFTMNFVGAGRLTATAAQTSWQDQASLAASGLLRANAALGPAANLVASFTPSTFRANFGGTVGFQFTPSTNLVFNQIGMMGANSVVGARNVYLSQSGVGTPLITASINLTGVPAGAFQYVNISPVTLVAGTTYGLFAAVINDGVQAWADSAPTTLNNVSSVTSAFATAVNPPNGSWSTFTANQQYFGLDLAFSSSGTIQWQDQAGFAATGAMQVTASGGTGTVPTRGASLLIGP